MSEARRVDQSMAAAASAILADDVVDARLRTRYRQLPVMLHTAGLAATYAYVLSKSSGDDPLGRAYRRIADGIRRHIGRNALIAGVGEHSTDRQFLEAMGDCDRTEYARAAATVATLAGWLSRLAEARYRTALAEKADAQRQAQAAGDGRPPQTADSPAEPGESE
ncbi:type III-B CRISPR module-associated protein Cmr5 [Streptomyces sp. NPDC049910]|uniref:type III-B CRISPR module-associated protein Cmr5 n=1 Tax=Streptomyces sp. NPDC049910 TaxID=3155278 RepID=UPI003419C824